MRRARGRGRLHRARPRDRGRGRAGLRAQPPARRGDARRGAARVRDERRAAAAAARLPAPARRAGLVRDDERQVAARHRAPRPALRRLLQQVSGLPLADDPRTPASRSADGAAGADGAARRRRSSSRALASLHAGATELQGRAWSGQGAIERVEVSTDGGATWAAPSWSRGGRPLGLARVDVAWTRPSRVTYELCCRATRRRGNAQPDEPLWNLGGYANNAVQRVPVNASASCGALRRDRRRRRAGRVGHGLPPRARGRARAPARPGPLPARQALRRRAHAARARQLPFDPAPVVEDVVDTFELGLRYGRGSSARRRAARADDAAAAARPLPRASRPPRRAPTSATASKVTAVEPDEDGVTVGWTAAPSGPTSSSAPTAPTGSPRRALGLGASIVARGRARGQRRATATSSEARYRGRAVVELGTVPGGYGWVFPKGDHVERRRRRLGVARGRGCASTWTRCARATAIAADAARRRARPPAADAARRRRGPARGSALLVGDAAGLVDPLSGDGMYEAFVSARLAAEAVLDLLAGRARDLEPYAPALDRELGAARRRLAGARRSPSTASRARPSRSRARRRSGGAFERLMRGERPHPGATRGLGAAPLRLVDGLRAGARAVLKTNRSRAADACERRWISHGPRSHPADAVELGASDIHLKVGQPPVFRRDGSLGALDGTPAARRRTSSRRRSQRITAIAPTKLADFRDTGELDIAYTGEGLPRFRVNAYPPARLDLVRVPRDPEAGAELRPTSAAARRRAARRGAPRPDPRHRRHRLGQDDDARGDHRPHQPHAAAAHRHDRGPDRDPPRRTAAASSTSARSASTPTSSARRSAARCARTRT